jgi:hypothetical protein
VNVSINAKKKKMQFSLKIERAVGKVVSLDLLRKRDLLSACFRLEHDKKKMQ